MHHSRNPAIEFNHSIREPNEKLQKHIAKTTKYILDDHKKKTSSQNWDHKILTILVVELHAKETTYANKIPCNILVNQRRRQNIQKTYKILHLN